MEDQQIIELYWARSEQAIRESETKYGAFCLSIARNILAQEQDAEECVNDTWLRAWNAMPPQRPGILSAFFGKLTRNLSLDRWRYNRAAKRGGPQVETALEELGECVSPEGSPEGELDRQAAEEALNRFLDGLPPLQREVFLRRYWYLDSIEDIARRAGWSKSRVTTTLHRLRVRLRAHLIREGIDV